MLATTQSQINIPPIIFCDDQKSEIRSINDIIPEYNNYCISNCTDLLYNLYNKKVKSRNSETNTNILYGIDMTKFYKTKNIIKISNHLYKFIDPFIYSIQKKEGEVITRNEYFNIFGYGETLEEAEEDLFEYVNELWESYVEEDDENLDDSAIKLKNNLLRTIRKIY